VRPNVQALDIFALILSAALHDHGHPGVTNAFLVSTRDDLAITYNDASVLEMFHIASSWQLMAHSCDIFDGLQPDQYADVRQTIVQCVLGTDMKFHFEHLTKFKTRAASGVLDSPDRSDLRLILTMCLHAADVSNPLKPWGLCVRWAAMVMTEFFAQGDKEGDMSVPVSPFMDRETTNIAKCQVGFVGFLLKPFFEEWTAWLGDDVNALICGHMKANMAMWEAEGEEALGDDLFSVKERPYVPPAADPPAASEGGQGSSVLRGLSTKSVTQSA